jgi:type III secretory pathway lipoprotein EscJ
MKTKMIFLLLVALCLTACDETFSVSTDSENVGNLI